VVKTLANGVQFAKIFFLLPNLLKEGIRHTFFTAKVFYYTVANNYHE